MKLFLDTTFGITVGLLDDQNEWLDYSFVDGQKGSAVIHKIILDLLEKNNLSIENVKALFQIAGPGSYTGMRVSDGISQIFDWQNITTYAFYHFDVPKLLNINSGIWFANAFKGELFLYKWIDETYEKYLLKTAEAIEQLLSSDIPIFTSFENDKVDCKYGLTKDLIKQNSKEIFDYVEENNLRKELYYFRTVDEEFSVGTKS
jgi:tRNA threonylcarbamoyladenosine biosynthesis protein TsaB